MCIEEKETQLIQDQTRFTGKCVWCDQQRSLKDSLLSLPVQTSIMTSHLTIGKCQIWNCRPGIVWWSCESRQILWGRTFTYLYCYTPHRFLSLRPTNMLPATTSTPSYQHCICVHLWLLKHVWFSFVYNYLSIRSVLSHPWRLPSLSLRSFVSSSWMN